MKKGLIYLLCGALLAGGCKTTGDGAYVGAQFGAILGSAIGGIGGGWRGSDIGTVVGMAGGAVAGAAIGSANEKAGRAKYEAHRRGVPSAHGIPAVMRPAAVKMTHGGMTHSGSGMMAGHKKLLGGTRAGLTRQTAAMTV